jgi:PucR-like helix-turn-helix protein/diguanylate cyclase with GGDEF domain
MAESLGTLHKASTETVLERMEREAAEIAKRAALACRSEVAEFGAVRDPAFAEEVVAHATEHVRMFVATARRGSPPAGAELDFVRERGARRARELMPLDAMLEVYHVGQRVMWEAVVAAAGDTPDGLRAAQELTAFTFRYTHAISAALADAYLAEAGAIAGAIDRSRRDLLDRLLSGVEPGGEEARRAEALDLAPEADHVVVVAQAREAEQAAAAGGSVVEDAGGAIEAQAGDAGVAAAARAVAAIEPGRPFVVARHGEVVAVLPVYVRRGPRELRAELERAAERVRRTHGVELHAGVSTVCSGLGELARGYGEARRALRHGGGVVALDDIALADYLVTGADETARRLVPRAVVALAEADRRANGALSATLDAYADCDLNVARAAERLVVHPNTVHYRLGRIRDLSGRDPRRFADLVELTTALRLIADRR